jgi:hypothetical protein
MAGKANVENLLLSFNGARFWAYISPDNDTENNVTEWSVTVQQTNGDWIGTITSENPTQILQTPGLSGIFKVIVVASGSKLAKQELTPADYSKPDIGCNSNCVSMIGIVSSAGTHYARGHEIRD